MAVPAPAIPSGNAYTLNTAHAATATSALPYFAAAAALLLRRHKIAVRMHVSGDSHTANALRATLNAAGAKPSAFSPAPSAEIPGEGFWKTTVNVVEFTNGEHFWAEQRADKKVEWEPLLIALTDRVSPADLPSHVAQLPDLWCVSIPEHITSESVTSIASRWIAAGAKAVTVLSPGAIAWKSTGSVFGQSEGTQHFATPATMDPARDRGLFTAGIVSGIFRDLLSENLFDKTLIRADRECLEMRPLRLGTAALNAAAALEAASILENSPEPKELLVKGSAFAETVDVRLNILRGPESKPWAHKGR